MNDLNNLKPILNIINNNQEAFKELNSIALNKTISTISKSIVSPIASLSKEIGDLNTFSDRVKKSFTTTD